MYKKGSARAGPESRQKQKQQQQLGSWELNLIGIYLVGICCPATLRMRKLHSKLSMKEDPSENRTLWSTPLLHAVPVLAMQLKMRAGAPLTHTSKHFIMMDGQHTHWENTPKPVLNSVSCCIFFCYSFFVRCCFCCLN